MIARLVQARKTEDLRERPDRRIDDIPELRIIAPTLSTMLPSIKACFESILSFLRDSSQQLKRPSCNQMSVTMLFDFDGSRVLFAGDLPLREFQTAVTIQLESHADKPIGSHFVKIPHHGGRGCQADGDVPEWDSVWQKLKPTESMSSIVLFLPAEQTNIIPTRTF